MSQSIPFPYRPAERGRGQRLRMLLSAVVGAIIGFVCFAIAEAAVGVVGSTLSQTAAAFDRPPPAPPRELPAEWRWERKAVDFDHMYRKKEAPRLDWIREGRD